VRLVVTGSHGPIGQAVRQTLAPGDAVTAVSRRPAPDEVAWLPEVGGRIDEPERLEGHDAAVHLAGAAEPTWRWTAAWRDAAHRRATLSTAMLADALASLRRPPAVLVAVGDAAWYGDGGDAVLDETAPPGEGFLARTAQALEAATASAADAGIRVVHLRAGLVLGRGFLGRLATLTSRGIGRRVGPGCQWWSWVTLDDLAAMVLRCITDDAMRGPVNGTAPDPVTADEFVAAVTRQHGVRPLVPLPAPMLRAVLGSAMAAETALASRRLEPAALRARGYRWRDPDLSAALAPARR